MTTDELTRLIELAGKVTLADARVPDAEYIAAANPETVRSLAEEVLRLRKASGALLARLTSEFRCVLCGKNGHGHARFCPTLDLAQALASLPSHDEPTTREEKAL